tara:strand:- start:4988 stop:5977 length:990 start_codon:yes stop_codon:yes gene_type:complete
MDNTRILIVAPAWLGDLVISLSFIRALKKVHKNSKIDLLVNKNLVGIAKYFPDISNVITSDTRHGKLSLIYRINLGYKLRKNKYSYCYILSNSLKSSIVPLIAKIKHRISYLGEFRYGFVNHIVKKIDRKAGMANRYLNLISSKYTPEYKPSISSEINNLSVLKRFDLKKRYVVLCPDAEYGPAKKWPIKKWIDLASILQNVCQVVFVGVSTSITMSPNKTKNDNYINLIGRTSLEEVAIILSQSTCVVSNDSGLMHVAAALGRPIVGIYGSSSPDYTPPLIESEKRAIIFQNLSCSPCFKKVCPLEHLNCLESISVDSVMQSVKNLIQ